MKKNNPSLIPAQNAEKRPTSKDVAAAAGVSQSTVCRVFDQKWSGRISTQIRERVLSVANEMGYSPNAIARSLTSQKSGIIGVIISEEFNIFYYDLLRRITNELQRFGMRVMVFNAAPYRDINMVFNKLVEYRVDGIIATAAAISNVLQTPAATSSTPLVLVNIYAQESFCSSVTTDNYSGSYQMATYLYDRGCRSFAYISAEKSRYFDVPDRKRGFIDGLMDKGCSDCLIFAGDYSYESGQRIAREIMSLEKRPDCIFSSGSRMAYGIMDTVRYQYQLTIPEQLSIAAYDDFIASDMDSYQITSVQQPSDELAKTSVRLLLQQIEGKKSIETIFSSPTLCIRKSVR